MSNSPAIDYNALAKQANAISSHPAGVDYAALAKQAGAVSSTSAPAPVSAPSRYENFTDDITRGLGLNPEAIRAQTSAGGQLLEMGKQVASGLGHYALNVAKDPAHIIDPLNSMASGVTTALGLPDKSSQSVFDPNSYSTPNLGKTVGALASVAAGVDEGAPAREVAGGVAKVATKPVGAVASTVKDIVNDATNNAGNKLGAKLVEPIISRTPTQIASDLKNGRNPARALVDEGISGDAKGMLDQIDQHLSDLSQQTDAALKATPPKSLINIEPIIDGSIDAAIKEAKKTGSDGVQTRLEALRTALKSEYGDLQDSPLAIQKIKQEIGTQAQNLGAFKATDPLEASAAGAMSDIYKRIDSELDAVAPATKSLNERAANLISAKTGLLRTLAKDNQSIFDNHSGIASGAAKKTIASPTVRSKIASIVSTPKD